MTTKGQCARIWLGKRRRYRYMAEISSFQTGDIRQKYWFEVVAKDNEL